MSYFRFPARPDTLERTISRWRFEPQVARRVSTASAERRLVINIFPGAIDPLGVQCAARGISLAMGHYIGWLGDKILPLLRIVSFFHWHDFFFQLETLFLLSRLAIHQTR